MKREVLVIMVAALTIISLLAGCANVKDGMVSASPTAPAVSGSNTTAGNGAGVNGGVPTIDPGGNVGGLGGAIEDIGEGVGNAVDDIGDAIVPGTPSPGSGVGSGVSASPRPSTSPKA